MRKVAIVGAGITPCKARWVNKTYWELAQWATKNAVDDAGINIKEVEAGVVGIYNDIFENMAIPESPLQGIIGLANKRLTRVTSGGATGAHAMTVGYEMVASGNYDLVLCLGVEKATDCYDFQSGSPTPEVIKTIAWSWDEHYERELGATASDSYAEVVLAYMDEYPGDLDPKVRARIVEILCQQAQNNPYAQRLGETVTAEQVLQSRYIVYPFRLLETCVYTEGAGALIYASEEKAKEICERTGKDPIWIEGLSIAHEPYFAGKTHKHKVMSRIYSDYLASHQAYEMAGVTAKDIQVVELHDAFVPQLMITMAEMGFTELGKSNDLIEKDIMAPHGKLLVNPSGGLTFGGHFVGGSNIFSAWSARREMLTKDLEWGLIHGTGASVSMFGCAMVLKRG